MKLRINSKGRWIITLILALMISFIGKPSPLPSKLSAVYAISGIHHVPGEVVKISNKTNLISDQNQDIQDTNRKNRKNTTSDGQSNTGSSDGKSGNNSDSQTEQNGNTEGTGNDGNSESDTTGDSQTEQTGGSGENGNTEGTENDGNSESDTAGDSQTEQTGGSGENGNTEGTQNEGNSESDTAGDSQTEQTGGSGENGNTEGTQNEGNSESGTAGNSHTGGSGENGNTSSTGNPGDAGSGTGVNANTHTSGSSNGFASVTWIGTISMTESMEAGENESLLSALTPGGEYDISKNWRIEVTFKYTDRYLGYELFDIKKAVLISFSDNFEQTMFNMERDGRVINGTSKETAEEHGRQLSSNEIDLRLAIDLATGNYWMKGDISIEGIKIKGLDEMEIKVEPINEEIDEDADGTTGIEEEVDITGTFSPLPDYSFPEKLLGKKDFLQDVPEEFREFLEDLGGKQTKIMTWTLKKKQ